MTDEDSHYLLTTTQKTACIVDEAYLPRRCIATEVIHLLLAYSLPRECVYRVVIEQ
jgi:hypothetical protein